MGNLVDECLQDYTKPCDCGRRPVWAKIRGGQFVLACPTPSCKLYLAVKGRTLPDTIETWNKEVAIHAKRRA